MPGNDKTQMPLFGPLISLLVVIVIMAAGYLIYDGLGKNMSFQPKPNVVLAPFDTSFLDDRVEDHIHIQTGLVYAVGFDAVRKNCTGCHSPKLITQNRATREGWHQMIRWMQETQGLWDLGRYESTILDYLAEHYAPEEVGRRPNLDGDEIEWYVLEQ
jgi:hypothetical protein